MHGSTRFPCPGFTEYTVPCRAYDAVSESFRRPRGRRIGPEITPVPPTPFSGNSCYLPPLLALPYAPVAAVPATGSVRPGRAGHRRRPERGGFARPGRTRWFRPSRDRGNAWPLPPGRRAPHGEKNVG
ncbi:hypothetical protein GCM10009551_042620 [Nocardiopsis tropica]